MQSQRRQRRSEEVRVAHRAHVGPAVAPDDEHVLPRGVETLELRLCARRRGGGARGRGRGA